MEPQREDHDHHISIHALREEGDNLELNPDVEVSKFLSTPSARRATELPGSDSE